MLPRRRSRGKPRAVRLAPGPSAVAFSPDVREGPMLREIEIDPDIRRARTLPAEFYHDPAWFDAARARIFARSWQLVPETRIPQEPGHAAPLRLLPGTLDVPLLAVRDAAGEVACLSNVCTHRGNVIIEEAGPISTIRCGYHGRTFELDGRFRSMPDFEGCEGFPSSDDDLPRLRTARWGPLLLATLGDPAFEPDALLAPVTERIAPLGLDRLTWDPATAREFEFDASWALYCDNFLEGFHIPWVHPALAKTLDYRGYRTDLFELSSIQIGIAADGEPAFDLPAGHPDAGSRVGGYYVFAFPNLMLNFYPWGLSLNLVEPLGPARTRVRYLCWVWDASLRDRGAGAGLDQVELEDETVVQSCQRGVASPLYDRGRYSPSREQGVHHFHRLLARFLNEGGGER